MRNSVNGYPTKQELRNATLQIISEDEKEYSTNWINDTVAKILNLSDEYLKLEDESGVGTVFNYRMRWIRTELKKEGKILNPQRGIWKKA